MIDINKDIVKQLLDVFPDCLSPRQKQVIEMRFGFNGNEKHTLQKVGDLFGVTRERIRQIENKAIRKLKHPSRLRKLPPIHPQRSSPTCGVFFCTVNSACPEFIEGLGIIRVTCLPPACRLGRVGTVVAGRPALKVPEVLARTINF